MRQVCLEGKFITERVCTNLSCLVQADSEALHIAITNFEGQSNYHMKAEKNYPDTVFDFIIA